MENKLFETDPKKHKHNILIEVYENCSILKVENIGDQKNMTYYEVIGVLETQKQGAMWTQRESNMKMKTGSSISKKKRKL